MAIIKISNSELESENKKLFGKIKSVEIPFREVSEAYLPDMEEEKILQYSCSVKFQYPFFVVMQKRKYELYAATSYDRVMWMSGFDYMIKSAKIVNAIMQENKEEEQKEQQKEALRIAEEHKNQ